MSAKHAELLLAMTPPDPNAARHLADLAAAIGAVCKRRGCDKPARAKGICDTHYRAFLREAQRTAKPCAECGQKFARHIDEPESKFARRACCGKSCATARQHKAAAAHAAEVFDPRRQATLEDLEWIIGTDNPDRIAGRLGYASADNLVRVLYRWGRPDLVARLVTAGAA